MADPLVLDSSVFKFNDFIFRLSGYHSRKILPVVAYTEISVWLVGKKGRSQSSVDAMLNKSGIELEWYNHQIAWKAVELSTAFGDFRKHARDYMIAAHAYTAPRIIVTENKRDFVFLGDRTKGPYELMYPDRSDGGRE